MTQPRSFPDKVLVLGLGKTGLSCARYLRSQGVTVGVMDSRQSPPELAAVRRELPDLPLFLGNFDPDVIRAAEWLIISPGVSLREPPIAEAAARGVPVIGDIELFAQAACAPVAAITGSNGKSTVTTLLGRMAHLAGVRTAVGGNLGQPALDLLDDGVELYVLELSSFQLESTRSLAPEVATVLNVSADHMDRYNSLANYAAAKQRILSGARTGVLNLDDPQVRAMVGMAVRDVGFSLGPPEKGLDFGVVAHGGTPWIGRRGDRLLPAAKAASFGVIEHGGTPWIARKGDSLLPADEVALFGVIEYDGVPWIARGGERLLPANEVLIKGRHNLANALAALAIGWACGLPEAAMLEALRTFPGLPHRTALVADKGGVDWYDDSKGTNPGATIAALDGLIDPGKPRRAILIAGGEGKGTDFTPLAPAVTRTTRAVVLVGRDAPLIERALDGRTRILHAKDMPDAVRRAFAAAWPGDCVLLSPACASFDMFEDYTHRGRVFAAAVETLEA